jgi:hypothetical protein
MPKPDCRHALPPGGARRAPPGARATRSLAVATRARRGAWFSDGARP